jgi:predicted Ser/Thr protein kinase
MKHKSNVSESMSSLFGKLEQKSDQSSIPLEDFLHSVSLLPRRTLRNIFQLMYDMIHYYIPGGTNEYPNDPHSINYIHYDTSNLFVKDTEVPFFADRLLANRLINVVDSLKRGVLKNKMLVFIGPPGSGKSTFLNIFLEKLEEYSGLDEGEMYETVWHLDTRKIGRPPIGSMVQKPETADPLKKLALWNHAADEGHRVMDNELIIPCPSHDHPIVQIPVEYRRQVLEDIIEDDEFKHELFSHKDYEWVLTKTACPICSSIYKALTEKVSPEEVFKMIYVRRYEFSRKLGEGISVYNPGDQLEKKPLKNAELQRWLDSLFKSSSAVSYTYSRLAKTNNGIFAIMDVKSNNVERVKNIHGIISDGIHKVGTTEETINSLFMALVNPEDFDVIDQEKSFRDRVINIPVPYIRDYTTEVEIYRNSYGRSVFEGFMPRILRVFAQIIVSSRLSRKSEGIHSWIKNPDKYFKFCDKELLLLLMEIYSGAIPHWLSEEDVQRMNRSIRRQIIQEGETQGRTGFSGRESIEMFNSFILRYSKPDVLITIDDVIEFFSAPKYTEKLPADFLSAIRNQYDYSTLQEVKESMFFYNQQQISNDIKNYLFAITVDGEGEVESPYTQEMIKISNDYLQGIEVELLGLENEDMNPKHFRDDQLRQYVSATLHQIKAGKPIEETEQYITLLNRFNRSLKENVMTPFIKNENFRRAIKDFDTATFKTYDKRIRSEVTLLFENLETKFGYSQKAARQICIYAIDNDLANMY